MVRSLECSAPFPHSPERGEGPDVALLIHRANMRKPPSNPNSIGAWGPSRWVNTSTSRDSDAAQVHRDR